MAYVQYGKPEYEADKTLPVCKNGLKEDFRTIFDELDMDIDGVREADGADWVVTASNEGENIVIQTPADFLFIGAECEGDGFEGCTVRIGKFRFESRFFRCRNGTAAIAPTRGGSSQRVLYPD